MDGDVGCDDLSRPDSPARDSGIESLTSAAFSGLRTEQIGAESSPADEEIKTEDKVSDDAKLAVEPESQCPCVKHRRRSSQANETVANADATEDDTTATDITVNEASPQVCLQQKEGSADTEGKNQSCEFLDEDEISRKAERLLSQSELNMRYSTDTPSSQETLADEDSCSAQPPIETLKVGDVCERNGNTATTTGLKVGTGEGILDTPDGCVPSSDIWCNVSSPNLRRRPDTLDLNNNNNNDDCGQEQQQQFEDDNNYPDQNKGGAAGGGGQSHQADVAQSPSGLVAPFFEIDFNDLAFHERCGGGSFGSVYRATWRSQKMIVAVKKLLVLQKEAQVLSILSHKNIIKFFGAATRAPNFCIVTEYAEHGSLYSFLGYQKQQDVMLTFPQILQWSIQIAAGMHYLHEEAPVKVIHRDLKSNNVVIAADFSCKICDFGASRFLSSTTKMSVAGTLPWMAPEVIQNLPSSEACDVWSYGVVLWELLTHEVPFKGIEGFQVAWVVVEKKEMRLSFGEILQHLSAMLYDDVIREQASTYLSQRSVWREEIESTLELLKRAEEDLSKKQKYLQDWENRLQQKEEQLEMKKLYMDLYTHDVNVWTESEVFLWVKQLGYRLKIEDLAEYAKKFLDEKISGKQLLSLDKEALKELGVNFLGHRMLLMEEIQKLRLENERLVDFPPLERTATGSGRSRRLSPIASGKSSPHTVTIHFVYGSHVRVGASAADHKWKMYLEVDETDSDLTLISCIREVTFEWTGLNGSGFGRITHPPYVMDRWCVGISEDTSVVCKVFFEKIVRKPTVIEFRYHVTVDAPQTCEQREVALVLHDSPPLPPSPSTRAAHFFRRKSNSSDCFLPDGATPWRGSRLLASVLGSPIRSPAGSWAAKVSSDRPDPDCEEDFPPLSASGTAKDAADLLDDISFFRTNGKTKKKHRGGLLSLNSSSEESLSDQTSGFVSATSRTRSTTTTSSSTGSGSKPIRYRHSSSDSGFGSRHVFPARTSLLSSFPERESTTAAAAVAAHDFADSFPSGLRSLSLGSGSRLLGSGGPRFELLNRLQPRKTRPGGGGLLDF